MACQARGGLSKAVEALGRSSFVGGEPKGLACPRGSRPIHARGWPENAEELEASRPLNSSSTPAYSTSAAARSDDHASLEAAGLAELRRLFASECSLGTSAPGFGVSPPVRSGAANGLVHDSLWRQEAPHACKVSLRTLHERAGPRCFASCAGDWTGLGDHRLLMASPDQSLQLLTGAVEREEGCGGGDEAMQVALATSLSSRPASRASPSAGWLHRASPDPADLFSY